MPHSFFFLAIYSEINRLKVSFKTSLFIIPDNLWIEISGNEKAANVLTQIMLYDVLIDFIEVVRFNQTLDYIGYGYHSLRIQKR